MDADLAVGDAVTFEIEMLEDSYQIFDVGLAEPETSE
jgi:hypothetical protein